MFGGCQVIRKMVYLLLLASLTVFADPRDDAMQARNKAMQALNGFNPATTLKEYTANPKELGLQPAEGDNSLAGIGYNALSSNPSAKEVYQSASIRPKVKSNPNSSEMRYAETLLENPDEVLEGVCYKQKAACESKSVLKTCEEAAQYKSISCQENLEVHVKSMNQVVTRRISIPSSKRTVTFDVTRCPENDRLCTASNLVVLSQPCEAIQVTVLLKSRSLVVTQQPTCFNPTVTVQLPGVGRGLANFQITLTEFLSEDVWKHEDCSQVQRKTSQGNCVLEESARCLEPDTVKVINGITVKRPCWKTQANFQCIDSINSTCTPFINQGCSQTSSTCINSENNRCQRYAQTFQCMEQFCMPERSVCPEKIGCSDGNCDSSVNEFSDDTQEGISRLGALSGVASDVAVNQVKSGVASVFTGTNSLCRIAVAGIGNCCGGSPRLLHCNEQERSLAKAIDERRAFKVGTYCAHRVVICTEEKQSWCVFPSKLSAIVQIQGRYHQLGINFGTAHEDTNKANCRGISPEELERINFSALNLSPILQELMARMRLPDSGVVGANNQAKVGQWNQEGKAHE